MFITKTNNISKRSVRDSDAFECAKSKLYQYSMRNFNASSKVYVPFSELYMTTDERLAIEKLAADIGCEVLFK